MSCSGDEHRFAPGASTCDCGQTRSSLPGAGLPYPSWRLEEHPRHGLRHSNDGLATDTETGRQYVIREYVPDPVPDPLAQRRRFITVAKSLRSSPLPSERILFAYTRGGRCYTVAETVPGTPLALLHHGSATPAHDSLSLLHALLSGLRQLHLSTASAGPLFHGHLRVEDILATGPGPDLRLHLLHSSYLDNLLRENPLPPEHFQQQDLLAAADITLAFAAGPGPPGTRQSRLQRVIDPILGSALEFLYGANGTRANTADAALGYLQLLQQAARGNDPVLFGKASAISPSPRLRPLTVPTQRTAPSAPPPQPAPTAAPKQDPPRTQPAPPATPPPPPPPPYKPVAAPRPAGAKRNSGCGGCLLTAVLALLVIGGVIMLLIRTTPSSTTLDFSADPNPAQRKAHVQLHWTSSGFQRLELDGKRVQANGSIDLVAKSSHHYTLEGIRKDGSREVREVDLTVVPHRSEKQSRDAGANSMSPGEPTAAAPVTGQTASVQQAPEAVQPQPSASPGTSAPAENDLDTGSPHSVDAPAPIVRALPPADLQGINNALRQWTEAMLSNDPEREAACYAPQLDRYFLRSGVTQSYVRQYLTDFRNRGSTITSFNISDPLTRPEPDGSAEVRFNKVVDLATPSGPRHQAVHSMLHLKQIDGSWKITFERDFFGPTRQP